MQQFSLRGRLDNTRLELLKLVHVFIVNHTCYTVVTSQEDDKNLILRGLHRVRFHSTMVTSTAIKAPLVIASRSPKLDKWLCVFPVTRVPLKLSRYSVQLGSS